MKRIIISLSILLLFSISLFAKEESKIYQFPKPEITYVGGYAHISIPQTSTFGNPGDPALPAFGVSLLLPYQTKGTITSITGNPIKIKIDAPVYPIQQQYPLSKIDSSIKPTKPNFAIYSLEQYPTNNFQNERTELYRGHSIFTAVINPIKYLPKENAILYFPEIKVVVNSVDNKSTNITANYRNDSATNKMLAEMIQNKEEIRSYPNVTQSKDRDNYDYLIVSYPDYVDQFQVLADYKNSLGLKTKIYTTDYIYQNSTGADNQEKIRNFIIDQYQNNGISYLLLAGDADKVPERGFAVMIDQNPDADIACDLYYSNLDGTWNDNNNNLWGEWNEKDLIGELAVGRASVGSTTEAQHFVHKQIMYQQSPVVADLTKGLMVGENLGWTPWGKDYMEEIRLGSTNWGYTTTGIPEQINVETLYDHDATWSPNQLYNKWNSGQNLVYHLGHANVNYVMKFYNSSVTTSNLTNNGVDHGYYILNTQGCYCNSFDNRSTEGQTLGYDAISEKLTNLANGPVCFIGNTRYGWGSGNDTNGASQHLQREFNDAIYAENITAIGDAHQKSKTDTAPFVTPTSVLLWSYYENTLLGDPTLDIWTNQPQTLVGDVPSVLPLGTHIINIPFTINGEYARNIRVTAIMNGEVLTSTITDDFGNCMMLLDTPLDQAGTLSLVASGHNILDTTFEINVVPTDEGYIIGQNLSIDDGANNQLDWNENAEIKIEAYNVGQQPVQNLYAKLELNSDYVSVLNDSIWFGEVEANSIVQNEQGFNITTAENVPENINIPITINFYSDQGNWSYSNNIILHTPTINFSNMDFSEANGNSNGMIEPGEEMTPSFKITNNSGFDLSYLAVKLVCDNENVTISPDTLLFMNYTDNQEITLNDIHVQLSDNLQIGDNLVFYLKTYTERGYQINKLINFNLSAFSQNFNTSDGGFTHTVVGTGHQDQWHYTTSENYGGSDGGSWKCGSDSGEYSPNLYASLITPQITVPENSYFTFYHKLDAETSTATIAYDGAFVQISTDGTNYTSIAPVGGYPFTMISQSTPPNEPCYSGTFDWSIAQFDLSDYANQTVQFRFVFTSDSYVQKNGWVIDNLVISTDNNLVPPTNLTYTLDENNLVHLMWNSPNSQIDGYQIKKNGIIIADDIVLNSFIDPEPISETSIYHYAVASKNGDLVSDYSPEISVQVTANNNHNDANIFTKLYSNYPNPFNPKTTIQFSLKEKTAVNLDIYNIKGQKVKSLINNEMKKGMHSITWNGNNSNNAKCASGIYFYRLKTKNYSKINKMLMLK